MSKNTIHTILILLLVFAISCISCSNYKNPEDDNSRKVIAKLRGINSIYNGVKYVEYIDRIYSVGDTIKLENYRISLIVDEIEFPPKECEYQVYLYNDSTSIWNNGRYVGYIPVDTTSAFDRLMMKDNE